MQTDVRFSYGNRGEYKYNHFESRDVGVFFQWLWYEISDELNDFDTKS